MSGEEERQKRLLQFASLAAHETVGPVEQLLALVALFIQRYRGKVDSEADILIELMERAKARLALTAEGLRKCFQVGATTQVATRVNMNEALDAALDALQGPIEDSKAQVYSEELPSAVGDRVLLSVLFQAIVDNALKFCSPGTSPRISVSAIHSANGQTFQVKDNGMGIESEFTETVFAPFKKLNGHAYPGAGLGLTLARMIVELHGGSIWIEPSTLGTTVRFELPAVVG
jgi:light-regulated signal transduction histidine kinase (bacteriophytochrome)